MLYILTILGLINLIGLGLVFFSQKSKTANYSVDAERLLRDLQVETDRLIKAEMAIGRKEAAEAEKRLREEVMGLFKNFSDSLEKRAMDSSNAQTRSLDAFSVKLSEVVEKNESKMERIRETVEKRLEIIKEYAKKDSRIKYFNSEKNLGYVIHLNKGIELARGEYIARMDADDVSLPKRFEKQIEYLDKNQDIAVLGTSTLNIDDKRNESKGWILNATKEETKVHFLFTNYIIHPSVIMRKKDLPLSNNSTSPYNPDFMPAEDFDLWTRILDKHNIYSLKEPLIKYRKHSNNISSKLKTGYSKASKILKRQLEKLGINPTDDEVEFHHSTSDFILDGKNIKDISNWFRKIWAHNNTAGIYKKHVLLSTMSGRMFLISRRIGGLSEVMRFTLDCAKDLSTYEKLKFFYLSFKRLISYLI